jgi:hypothetical protein
MDAMWLDMQRWQAARLLYNVAELWSSLSQTAMASLKCFSASLRSPQQLMRDVRNVDKI